MWRLTCMFTWDGDKLLIWCTNIMFIHQTSLYIKCHLYTLKVDCNEYPAPGIFMMHSYQWLLVPPDVHPAATLSLSCTLPSTFTSSSCVFYMTLVIWPWSHSLMSSQSSFCALLYCLFSPTVKIFLLFIFLTASPNVTFCLHIVDLVPIFYIIQ